MKFWTKEYHNMMPEQLRDEILRLWVGNVSDLRECLVVNTWTFTWRSPDDRFIVRDSITEHTVDRWDRNHSINVAVYDQIYTDLLAYMSTRDVYVRDCAAGKWQNGWKAALSLRCVTTSPVSDLFVYNMFLDEQYPTHPNHRLLFQAPDYTPPTELIWWEWSLTNTNFVIINFTTKHILIWWTWYTWEIKKSVFSVLNYQLPEQGILPMHCASNQWSWGEVALFFGLSGTWKTTLSASWNRFLIGDDEHGRDDDGIFNIEWGCYAKCIWLDPEKEPHIFEAIQWSALLENIPLTQNWVIDFTDSSITQNTRVSYPHEHLSHRVPSMRWSHPKHVFFLTCDALGVLPPLAKLTMKQAGEWFRLWYTSKIPGTEQEVTEPIMTFSACFGAPFMPRKIDEYVQLLEDKLQKYWSDVWLINTGWRGSYKNWSRFPLEVTRLLVKSVLDNVFEHIDFSCESYFWLSVPAVCPWIEQSFLDPMSARQDVEAYKKAALMLKQQFDIRR